MIEYLGVTVSAELHVKPRKTLAQPHAELIKVCCECGLVEVHQGGILEGGEGGWVGDPLSGR